MAFPVLGYAKTARTERKHWGNPVTKVTGLLGWGRRRALGSLLLDANIPSARRAETPVARRAAPINARDAARGGGGARTHSEEGSGRRALNRMEPESSTEVAKEKEPQPTDDIDSNGCPGRRFRLSRVDLPEKLRIFGRTADQAEHQKNDEDQPLHHKRSPSPRRPARPLPRRLRGVLKVSFRLVR